MKRGIFRIVSGVVIILLQILTIIMRDTVFPYGRIDIWFSARNIVGIILLGYGICAYSDGLYSKLVLHQNSNKFYSVIRWITFIVTTICLLLRIVSLVDDFDVHTLLVGFSTLSFSVYLLFYVYRKPSCLFSATLVFIGVTRLYDFCTNVYDLYDESLFIRFRVIAMLISGILYIVIATKLYKERFSVRNIRILGWIVFILELFGGILQRFILFARTQYFILNYSSFDLFLLGLFIYTSVLRMNTLNQFCDKDTPNKICFCHKCGKSLLENSKFCRGCGTEIKEN